MTAKGTAFGARGCVPCVWRRVCARVYTISSVHCARGHAPQSHACEVCDRCATPPRKADGANSHRYTQCRGRRAHGSRFKLFAIDKIATSQLAYPYAFIDTAQLLIAFYPDYPTAQGKRRTALRFYRTCGYRARYRAVPVRGWVVAVPMCLQRRSSLDGSGSACDPPQ